MTSDQKVDDLHQQLFEEGVKVRWAVLGSEYVDRALQNATAFSRPGQELITEWAWGNVWRSGLDRKQRSLLTLGIIIAQKAWLELALHTRGAINNGVSELEIRETVLHATVYCGTPAGAEAMMVTERTINEMVEKGEYKRLETSLG
ncbi:4-carboxymuconolactone decarboxylase [Trichoderma arundinaceum]|uniref:4-carboxymuconolactone decarboxylase n=1 Tax=Trichoderma arundinaceum TaxID=490622 RepID=A0A395N8Q6_TRIAR|nr:4-carboxymuconolactone decarboxylase [Trichoderma arundinaceum]